MSANGTIQQKNKYLDNILTAACKQAIKQKLGQTEPPTLDQGIQIVQEMYLMGKTDTHCETAGGPNGEKVGQMEKDNEMLDIYRT